MTLWRNWDAERDRIDAVERSPPLTLPLLHPLSTRSHFLPYFQNVLKLN